MAINWLASLKYVPWSKVINNRLRRAFGSCIEQVIALAWAMHG